MPDITITAANVVAGSNSTVQTGILGGTVTAGQVGYLDDADGKWKLADNNSATVAARTPMGIFLNGGANNQPVSVLREGDITIGGTMVAGVAYYLSDVAGGICPVADLATGETSSIIGMATTTTNLRVKFQSSGVTL